MEGELNLFPQRKERKGLVMARDRRTAEPHPTGVLFFMVFMVLVRRLMGFNDGEGSRRCEHKQGDLHAVDADTGSGYDSAVDEKEMDEQRSWTACLYLFRAPFCNPCLNLPISTTTADIVSSHQRDFRRAWLLGRQRKI